MITYETKKTWRIFRLSPDGLLKPPRDKWGDEVSKSYDSKEQAVWALEDEHLELCGTYLVIMQLEREPK